MTAVARSFFAFLRKGIAVMLQYRGEIVLWAIWGLVNPAVSYALWSAAAESNADGTIAGFGRGEFAAYFFAMMIVGHLTQAWDTYEIGHLVRSGEMSPKLLRPILPIWEALAGNLSYKITTLVFVVPMWCLFAWLVRPTFETSAWQLGLGLIAIVLGAVLNFVLNYVFALVAFWTPKLDAMGELYFGACMLWGGRFAPLDALPDILRWLSGLQPFKWMFAFPSELIMGRITDPSEAFRGLGIQLAWIAVSIVGFRVLWSVAVKRYTAVSG